MTPLTRLLHRALERLLDRWEEGPECPDRILDVVDEFQARVPGALPLEWARLARAIAASAYQQGYARGYEATERVERPWRRHPSPEFLADLEDGEWRSSPPVDLR